LDITVALVDVFLGDQRGFRGMSVNE
jgi:hypothetical protein